MDKHLLTFIWLVLFPHLIMCLTLLPISFKLKPVKHPPRPTFSTRYPQVSEPQSSIPKQQLNSPFLITPLPLKFFIILILLSSCINGEKSHLISFFIYSFLVLPRKQRRHLRMYNHFTFPFICPKFQNPCSRLLSVLGRVYLLFHSPSFVFLRIP
jgi:hypothetical protein